MQIVIEISSYDKEWITNGYYIPREINMEIARAIANGTPLSNSEKTNKWIPVTDRLPEEKINPITKDFYIYPVTMKYDDVYDIRYYAFGRGHWWHGPEKMDRYVLAWMPLPKPWRGEEDADRY